MYYLEALKQSWKDMAYRAVNGNGTETASNNENNGAVSRQTGVFKSSQPIALQEFFTYGGTGKECLFFWKVSQGFREITADFSR